MASWQVTGIDVPCRPLSDSRQHVCLLDCLLYRGFERPTRETCDADEMRMKLDLSESETRLVAV